MSTTFPTTKQTIPNPTATDLLENASPTLDHDYQHATINDTVEALEDKVGIDGSVVTTSHSYKLALITGANQAVSTDGTGQTLTNITLTNPQMNFGGDATGDMYYRSALGTTARLPIGTAGQIIQTSVAGIPEWIANPSAADASTTVKGVSELATLAETLARTTTGGTGAKLVVTPDNLTTVQTYDYAASATGNDTYVITVTPAPTAYVTGQRFTFKADVANTGTCSLNVNSLGATNIVKNVSAQLSDGDIIAGQVVTVVYDGTNFQLESKTANNFTVKTSYVAGTTINPSAVTNQTITHGLGFVPRLVQLMVQNTSSSGGGGISTSHGTAEISPSGTVISQQAVVAISSGTLTTRYTSSGIAMATGNGGSTVATLSNVTSTTFDIQWADPGGNVNGTPAIIYTVQA